MSFTQATITHKFQNADGTVPAGTVTFALSKRMTNGGTTLVPSEVTDTLDGSGNLSVSLTSNNDVGTVPGDAMWLATVRITSPQPHTMGPYPIAVPTGGGTYDLFSLTPQNEIGSA